MICEICGGEMIYTEHIMKDYSGTHRIKAPTCTKCKAIMRWDKYGEILE